MGSVQRNNWKEFIIKPVGGTIAIGVERFKLSECLKDPLIIQNYFNEYKAQYDKFLIQELIKGFTKQGEIKMFWINGEYSYAVNIIDGGSYDNYHVLNVKNKKILDECKKIGKNTLNALPKIKVGKKNLLKKMLCDGVLVSTPAGSTAYNLSVNGPILSLNSNKLAITPISPFRPRRWRGKIVSSSSIIKVLKSITKETTTLVKSKSVGTTKLTTPSR